MGSRILALILILSIVAGCDGEGAAWQEAEVDGSREALESFLEQFPDGGHATEANVLLTQLAADADWAAMGESPAITELGDFIEAYPQDARIDGARATLSRLESSRDWDAAIGDPSAKVFADYVAAYPDGANVSQAKFRLRIHERMDEKSAKALRVVPAIILDTSSESDGIAFEFDERFDAPSNGMLIESMSLQDASTNLVYDEPDRKKGQRIQLFMALMPQDIGYGRSMDMWMPIGFHAVAKVD